MVIPSSQRLRLAFYGVVGAVAPDIILLYSKRWTMPSVSFDPLLYVAATVLYLGLAAIVASIFPYGRNASSWKAFAIGVGLPVLISGLASLQHGIVISPRGESIQGTLWDLIAIR